MPQIEDPMERMIALTKWYLSGFYIRPKGVKKVTDRKNNLVALLLALLLASLFGGGLVRPPLPL